MTVFPSRRTLACPRCLDPVSAVTAHTVSYYDPCFTHDCGFQGPLRWSRPARVRRLKTALPQQAVLPLKHPSGAGKNTRADKRTAETASAAARKAVQVSKAGAVRLRKPPELVAALPTRKQPARSRPAARDGRMRLFP